AYESSINQDPEILVTEDSYLYMDVARRQVRAGANEIRLTPTEFELLRQLMLFAGKVLTHRVLLRAVWGPEYGEEADYLRVYIRQLRLKVEAEPSKPQYILTEPGIGYVFRANVETRNNVEAGNV
ncbi:MAG: response regulator transcription factor, partial [Ktedonobacteraceae bacterium]|nr:response regulator transcription factor [Ktedonobacteraceae bacterium]